MRLPRFITFISASVLVLLCARVSFEFVNGLRPDYEFCTLDDEVYQAINNNAEEWIRTFQERKLSGDITWGSFVFSTSPGRSYSVQAYDTFFLSELLVVVEHSWNERLGFIGYIYSSTDAPGLGEKYEVTYLANGIYCYERKVGFE